MVAWSSAARLLCCGLYDRITELCVTVAPRVTYCNAFSCSEALR